MLNISNILNTDLSTNTKKNTKLIILLLIFIMASAFSIYFLVIKKQHMQNRSSIKINGVVLTQAKEIDDFNLIDSNGKPFTKEALKGHWTLMFFGFTNCDVVCPTSMVALNKMYLILKKELQENHLPQVVLVTVDPERDNVIKMKNYVMAFNPHFIGVSGKISETVALEKQLNILAVKIHTTDHDKNDYSVDHSADILIFNPNAKLQAYMAYPHKPKQMAKDYKTILSIG